VCPNWVKEGWGVYSCHAWPSSYDHRPSYSFNDVAEHVRLSPTRQKFLEPNVGLHDGCFGVAVVIMLFCLMFCSPTTLLFGESGVVGYGSGEWRAGGRDGR